jgi:sarcosine oxidase
MAIFDVIVIGLGAMGSAAAHMTAKRGKRMLGLEYFTSPHDKGSSHGSSRIIRQSYWEDPSYVPLLLRSYELWEELERETHAKLLHLTGAIMVGSQTGELVQGSIRSAQQHNLPHEILSAKEIRKRFPALTPEPHEIALYESRAGYLLPEESIRRQLAQAARYGADLHFEEPIVSWSVNNSNDGVKVTTAKAAYEAERLIICAGPWSPRLLAGLNLPLEVTRQVMFWFDPIGGVEPFLPERFPVFMWERDGDFHLYGFPAIDGKTGGVKAAFHGSHNRCTPESIDRGIHPEDSAALKAKLATRIPALTGPLVKALTCLYTMTPDDHFVLGMHPQHPAVAIAAGFSGHGVRFATVAGEILADLAVDGATQHKIAFLSPDRFHARNEDTATPGA